MNLKEQKRLICFAWENTPKSEKEQQNAFEKIQRLFRSLQRICKYEADRYSRYDFAYMEDMYLLHTYLQKSDYIAACSVLFRLLSMDGMTGREYLSVLLMTLEEYCDD